jgi:epoxyqueuosine reductase
MRTLTSDPQKLRALIDRQAAAAGFDAVAVTRPDSIPQAPARLARFVADGFHGSMEWIAETLARRADPTTLWPDVRSIIVLAMNYGPDSDPLAVLSQPDCGAISVYARNRDYHDVMKGRLKEIAGQLAARAGGDVKVFVDTAPVMEKPLAEAAGLGWQGKHTNLVSRSHGSWLLLGSIFTTAELEPDRPEQDHCGSCRACMDACPTQAFPTPYRLDARRCISYLTIENKGPIPQAFREAIGNRIYGCDDCLAVCPWNKFAKAASEAKLVAREDLRAPRLGDLLSLDDAGFRALFSGSPVKRIGRDRFLRNVLIAAGNSGDPGLAVPVRMLLDDASPLVRGAAVWALARLAPNDLRDNVGRAESENDPDVRQEWELAAGVAPSGRSAPVGGDSRPREPDVQQALAPGGILSVAGRG